MAFRFGTRRSLGAGLIGGGGGAILKPQDVFAILAQPANQMQAAINALPFTPDLLAGKDRVATGDWSWRDSLTGLNNTLASNTTAAQAAWPAYSGTNNRIEYAHKTAPKFLAVGTFTHTNGTVDNFDLSILGAIGDAVVKRRDAAGDWYAWHRSLTAGNNLKLNTTEAQSAANAFISVSGTTLTFSASAPSGFYTYEAFAHDPSAYGIVQCGSLTEATGGITVNLGWQPQFLLVKSVSSAGDWYIFDTSRGWTTASRSTLSPNTSGAEETSITDFCSPTATGFTFGKSGFYGNGTSVIYLAIRAPY